MRYLPAYLWRGASVMADTEVTDRCSFCGRKRTAEDDRMVTIKAVRSVERALLARASEIGSDYAAARAAAAAHGVQSNLAEIIADAVATLVATEFTALAEELHWH